MAATPEEAYNEIKIFIDRQGKLYPAWYVGIASDVDTRLFIDHNVSRINDRWVYDQCPNNQGARNVEDALIKLGCDGSSGGGDQLSTYVYAYLKSRNTKP